MGDYQHEMLLAMFLPNTYTIILNGELIYIYLFWGSWKRLKRFRRTQIKRDLFAELA